MKVTQTNRGFGIVNFTDYYGAKCSVQKSSLATEDAIWFGIDDAEPKIMASAAVRLGVETTEKVGWIDYPIPKEVLLTTRMHLTRDQVIDLIPILTRFVKSGSL